MIIVLTAVTCGVLMLIVNRTMLGKSMRAVASDREAAEMLGVNVDRTIALTFFIGSVIAGFAGVMSGLEFGSISNTIGFLAGLKAFTAAVIGGIGSIPGAMLGGLIVGLAESYATGYLPQGSTFQNLYVFAVLIVFILIRPQGLLGRADVNKV
jgi:branched-chain amino acid transport system permease protein